MDNFIKQGFIDRCIQNNITDIHQINSLMKMAEESIWERNPNLQNTLLGAGIGAGIGGLGGYMTTGTGRGALAGGVLGGVGGAGVGYFGGDRIKNYFTNNKLPDDETEENSGTRTTGTGTTGTGTAGTRTTGTGTTGTRTTETGTTGTGTAGTGTTGTGTTGTGTTGTGTAGARNINTGFRPTEDVIARRRRNSISQAREQAIQQLRSTSENFASISPEALYTVLPSLEDINSLIAEREQSLGANFTENGASMLANEIYRNSLENAANRLAAGAERSPVIGNYLNEFQQGFVEGPLSRGARAVGRSFRDIPQNLRYGRQIYNDFYNDYISGGYIDSIPGRISEYLNREVRPSSPPHLTGEF